jgi:predicted nuclease of predicted toxin-antitoxin system
VKFIANMGISPSTVAFLRQNGHQASHLHELGLDRLSDEEILEKARVESAVILTADLDFGDLLAVQGTALPSVITFRLQPPMTSTKVNRYLERILQQHMRVLEQGVIISVNEHSVRVRRLPI